MYTTTRTTAAWFPHGLRTLFALALSCLATPVAADSPASQRFEAQALPVLTQYCFDCHGHGSAEGGVALDGDASQAKFLADRQLWWKVLKNVRAGVMPPDGAEAPSADETRQLARWIKTDAFDIDVEQVDPGPEVVRRLSRTEYRHTIRDLMGIDYNVEIEFPPDDSGFGFDHVADGQTLSPMLVEKYLSAAETIVARTVPTTRHVATHQQFSGESFVGSDNSFSGEWIPGDKPATATCKFRIDKPGAYRVVLDCAIDGSFDFHSGRFKATFSIDGKLQSEEEYGWQEELPIDDAYETSFDSGEHQLKIAIEPLPADPAQEKNKAEIGGSTHIAYKVNHVRLEGPLDPSNYRAPPRYEEFFPRARPPENRDEQRAYAADVLQRFATRAFRRPADRKSVERLAALAEMAYEQPGTTFETGVARAMTAVLASPRFLLRTDYRLDDQGSEPFPAVDDYSLAARLSYFLWSTMPDDELIRLADDGKLRENLDAQFERMIRDERSGAMIRNFVGQWLRARDVEFVSIDALAASGQKGQFRKLIHESRRRFGQRRRGSGDNPDEELSEEERAQKEALSARIAELGALRESFNHPIRQAMRRETEMSFAHLLRENRSLLELIDCDYAFLNEPLAKFYGIEGVSGNQMRKVELPADSPRGGVLTQGVMLTITSNPTRTSPVKRGLFILDNILGAPPPPPPADIPELGEAAEKFGDREPTLREMLEVHRESPLCHSCHARMDPLGLALENFNALGQWRDQQQGQPIDASGELVTGETFAGVDELKRILVNKHRENFYRCFTEKLLTYALGRGLDYYDVHTVDVIVENLMKGDGEITTAFRGVIHSAPFQRMRAVP